MARRGKRGRDVVDGLLLLNKPAGLSSNQALQRVKHKLNAQKAGHTGSLDPAATGMLPLCFGEATKVSAFLLGADKTYRVVARLGERKDSGDATGATTATAAVPELSFDAWNEILQSFAGRSTQIPPMYSALKKDGQRLYELARRGEEVEREPRDIEIFGIELLELAGRRLVFRARCSKGTYIRTLVEDIAQTAGTLAYTQSLHRESVAHFDASRMIEMSAVESATSTDAVKAWLIPPDQALVSMASARVSSDDAERFCGGQVIGGVREQPGLIRVYRDDDQFLGVGELALDGKLSPKRVFHMSATREAVNTGSDARKGEKYL